MTCFYMILWIHPLLFFQTAFSTPRRLLRRLPFYTCRRSGVCRQRSRILPRVLTCLRICFSVSIPVLVSCYNLIEEISRVRRRGLSIARPYSHSTDKDLWSLSWIHFFGVTMQDIYQKYQERGGLPVFHPENITAFTELHKSLFTLASSDDYIRDMRINSGLNEFLVLLMNESCNPAERSDAILKKQSLDPIREYLDTHYTEKVSLDALADQFFISKFYLTRVFKEQFWLSINTYVLNLRITKAKQMLRFTDKNWKILTTNVALGHHTISAVFLSMSRGITPSEFHEKLGEAGKQPTENLT